MARCLRLTRRLSSRSLVTTTRASSVEVCPPSIRAVATAHLGCWDSRTTWGEGNGTVTAEGAEAAGAAAEVEEEEEEAEETEEAEEEETEEEEAARAGEAEEAAEEAAAGRVRARAAAAMAGGTRAATTTAANTRGVTRARSRQDPIPHTAIPAASRPDRSERGCTGSVQRPTSLAHGVYVVPHQHQRRLSDAALAKCLTRPSTPLVWMVCTWAYEWS